MCRSFDFYSPPVRKKGMVEAGLPPKVLVAKIDRSPGDFETSRDLRHPPMRAGSWLHWGQHQDLIQQNGLNGRKELRVSVRVQVPPHTAVKVPQGVTVQAWPLHAI